MLEILHSEVVSAIEAFLSDHGLPSVSASLRPCPSAEMGDVGTGAALAVAGASGGSPMVLADGLARALSGCGSVASAEAAPPGHVNIAFADSAISDAVAAQVADPRHGIRDAYRRERVVIDFGGPNVKPMHGGHLRSLVVGECIRRMLAAVGHDVVSDIHLGDWGLPAGMILSELRIRHPGAPWFSEDATGPFPEASPVSTVDLATLYPEASAACGEDADRMGLARKAALELQAGHPGPSALRSSVVSVARADILASCARLGVRFDLLLGESDAQPFIADMLERMEASGVARRDGDALVVDVREDGDRKEVPPLVVAKTDGAALYATTDLATIVMRRDSLAPDRILYVADERQSLHFLRVFRAAERAGLAPGIALEHVGFGTVDGPDRKPLRTRSGGAMSLDALLDLARDAAVARMSETERRIGPGHPDFSATADMIGIAAVRIADLQSKRGKGLRARPRKGRFVRRSHRPLPALLGRPHPAHPGEGFRNGWFAAPRDASRPGTRHRVPGAWCRRLAGGGRARSGRVGVVGLRARHRVRPLLRLLPRRVRDGRTAPPVPHHAVHRDRAGAVREPEASGMRHPGRDVKVSVRPRRNLQGRGVRACIGCRASPVFAS